MGKFIKIQKEQIEEALKDISRQYFVGNLKKKQKIEHINHSGLEIGLTEYKEYTTEDPHFHDIAMEFQYMISGWTKYLDVSTNVEYEFKSGDFFAIEKGTIYTQKSKKGTKILFIKVPSINDKQIYEIDENTEKWLTDGLNGIRKDHYYDDNSPKANSICPAAAVAILNDSKILMLKRKDSNKWTMPGGTLEFGESMIDCALREIKEESGYEIIITDIIGTYTDPNIKVEYSDGEVRQEFTIVYKGEIVSGQINLDDESTNYTWVDLENVEKLTMADSQKRRIEDVKKFISTGMKTLR